VIDSVDAPAERIAPHSHRQPSPLTELDLVIPVELSVEPARP
jgi:hypothetical protein